MQGECGCNIDPYWALAWVDGLYEQGEACDREDQLSDVIHWASDLVEGDHKAHRKGGHAQHGQQAKTDGVTLKQTGFE